MDLNSLIAKRAQAWEAYQAILARSATAEELSAEDRSALDAAEADIARMSQDIERLQRADALRTQFDTVDRSDVPAGDVRSDTAPDEAYSEAFQSFLRRGIGSVSAEHRQLLEQGFVPGDDLRAQGVATDAAGGFLVPEGFLNKMTETMKFFSSLLDIANVITTTTGNDLVWPSNDDTGNKGAILAENTQVTEQDVVLGQKSLKAHMYTSKLVRVSYQLLQDAAFDLDGWLPGKLGERIGRIYNEHFTTGTGTNQPEGVQTNAVVGVTGAAGQTTSVVYDDLVDLEHSVDVAYRNERSRYMWHDLTLAKLRKLKDADGRPLWEPSLQVGTVDRFNGRPYKVNNDMPVMAASAKSILFGDFSAGYIVRQVRSVQTLRLTERYADFLQVGFLGFARADGKPDDPGAIRAYQNPAA